MDRAFIVACRLKPRRVVLHEATVVVQNRSDDSAWTTRAKEILERTGAQDVSSTGEATTDKVDKTPIHKVA